MLRRKSSRETVMAARAASRVATSRPRGDDQHPAVNPRSRRRGRGSLVLTALVFLAVIIGMLVLMIKLSG